MATRRASKVVFVGNIPYDATEEQLVEIFSQVGPVASFRMVNDRDTGKPKGFGFCEYRDATTAMSAMRNLNGAELSGRPLRVDFAESERSRDRDRDREMQDPHRETRDEAVAPRQAAAAPTILSPQDQIKNILTSMPEGKLHETFTQMKELIQANPNDAKQILINNPQLGHALLQAMIHMSAVNTLPQSFQSTQSVPPSGSQLSSSILGSAPSSGNSQAPFGNVSAPPPSSVPPNYLKMDALNQGSWTNTDSTSTSETLPVLPSFPTPDQGEVPVALQQQTSVILKQLMSLSEDQLQQLPPQNRAQIEQIKQTVLSAGMKASAPGAHKIT